MGTDPVLNVLRAAIDRKGVLPLNEQLRSAVEMAVIEGGLQAGMLLPSVRNLARELNLASNTVVRAYRDLENEGVLRVVPRRGYFVVGLPESTATPADGEVEGLIDEALRAAASAGMDRRQVLQIVAERARELAKGKKKVAVVGRRHAALSERVAETANAVADLGVDVIGLSFEELATPEGSAKASGIDWYLVSVLETREAVTLLGPHAHRVVPMTRTLRADVRAFITSQPAATRFGVIAGDGYVGRTLATLHRLHPLQIPPLATGVSDKSAIERVLRDAEVILIGSLARPLLQARLPLSKPWIELINIPDEATLRRLRSRLTQ